MLAEVEIAADLHPGQLEVHNSPARFKVLAAGRRWGKTRLSVNEALSVAINGGHAWWVAPTYKTSNVGWLPIMRMSNAIPDAAVRLSDKLVVMPGGGMIEIRSADNVDNLRGEGLDLVVVDEAAFVNKEAWAVLRPSLSDKKGKAILISTPKGRNWFWDRYQAGLRGDDGWQAWTFPTSSNPYIDPAEIEAARGDMPEITFRQEYLAEFTDDQGSVFRRVRDAVFGFALDEPEKGRQYSASVDVASSVDYTVVTIWDDEAKRAVHIDRFNRVDYPVLEQRLEAAYRRWGLSSMTIESNSIGQSVIDHLRARGLHIVSFLTTAASKQVAIQDLQAAFENSEIGIPNDQVLIGELLSFEGKRNASGTFSYSAPAGMHDDCVMSLAIGWSGMQERVQVIKNPFYEY